MNEVLVKELIRCKLAAADRITGLLPPELSKEVKSLRRILWECLAEKPETRPREGINNIKIE